MARKMINKLKKEVTMGKILGIDLGTAPTGASQKSIKSKVHKVERG